MTWTNTSDTDDRTHEHPSPTLEPQVETQDPCLHVLLRDDLWIVRGARSNRAIAAFVTREQAIARAQRIATRAGTGVVIH